MKTRIKLSKELTFLLAIIIMPFSIAISTKADLGLSMIAAPTYIISEKVSFLTYGQTEYIVQTTVLALMCIAVGKLRWSYLTSFLTAIVYGSILDFFIWCLKDISLTAMWMRIVVFIIGMILTSLSVALFMNTYLAPCAYDYFVRTVVTEKKLDLRKFKLGFDFCFLILGIILTLALFHKFIGVTWGTIVIAVCNGNIIAFMNKQMEKHIDFFTRFEKLERLF